MKNQIRLTGFILLTAALFISGCGIKFIYNQLDWMIPWYIEDYVSLNENQELLLDQNLTRYLVQHRQQQLPTYAKFFDDIANMVEDGLSDQDIDRLFKQTEQFRIQIFSTIPVSFGDIFLSLNDQQITEITIKLNHDLDDLTERYIDKKEFKQRDIRNEELDKFLEGRLGELNSKQKNLLEKWAQEYILIGPEFIQSRKLWQNQLLEVLHQRHKDNNFQSRLSALFKNRYLGRTKQHQKKIDFNERLLRQLYLDIDKSMDSYQRQKLVNNIRDYAEDFRLLSNQKL